MFNMHVTVIVKAKRLLNYTKNELSENDTPGDFILVEGQNLLYRLQDCAVLWKSIPNDSGDYKTTFNWIILS